MVDDERQSRSWKDRISLLSEKSVELEPVQTESVRTDSITIDLDQLGWDDIDIEFDEDERVYTITEAEGAGKK